MTSTPRLFLDVTQVSTQAFFTGIQRTIREVAEHNADRVTLVRFEPKSRTYRIVSRIPRLIIRQRPQTTSWLLKILGAPFLLLSSLVRTQTRNSLRLPRAIVLAGRTIHQWLFSEFALEAYPSWWLGPIWSPQRADHLLVLDVPQDLDHLSHLTSLAKANLCSVTCYLYDLIPIRQAAQYDPRPERIRIGSFREYLEFVDNSHKVVFLSEFTKEDYVDYLGNPADQPPRVTSRVYLPLPPNFGKEANPRRPKGGVLSILGVGALDIRKNFLVVLQAMEILDQKGVDFSVTIVAGSAKLIDPRISEFIREHQDLANNRLTILEAVTDTRLKGLYDRSAVVVVPSIAEGFGLPVVEALARGNNVVASRASSLIELAKYFPVDLADPYSPEEWAQKILASADKPRVEWEVPDEFPRDWRDFLDRLLLASST